MSGSDRLGDPAVMPPTELLQAISSTMIETLYQPIVRIADRRVIAVEALVRLNHPSHGVLLPERFVPQAEDAGLGPALTKAVSARALGDMAAPGLASSSISVTLNFPLDVLLEPSALALLEAQRQASRVPASRIVVELTESRPVEDLDRLSGAVQSLRDLGYHVAIDDVGPAVPAVDALLQLPFNGLKLDKSVIQADPRNAEAQAFLAKVLAAAKARGMLVVAEGVETEETWQRMQALGVDMVQGFLVAHPMPIGDVPAWIAAWRARAPQR
jgi:EAL domain-containing protein (putative c-di-GMP-specific phosphodiesterase class I)